MFDSGLVQSGYTLKNTKRFSTAIENLSASMLSSSSGAADVFEEPVSSKQKTEDKKFDSAEDHHDEL